jgi:hypothetical protein
MIKRMYIGTFAPLKNKLKVKRRYNYFKYHKPAMAIFMRRKYSLDFFL